MGMFVYFSELNFNTMPTPFSGLRKRVNFCCLVTCITIINIKPGYVISRRYVITCAFNVFL